jgi:hypothetical protein
MSAMPNPIETAIETYIQAWSERDPALRKTLIEACFAADGRIVTRGREIVGRAAFADAIAGFHAASDSQFRGIRLTSAIDVGRTTFRFSGLIEYRDGTTSVEAFDAGEIDASGRISVLFSFDGVLQKPATGSSRQT